MNVKRSIMLCGHFNMERSRIPTMIGSAWTRLRLPLCNEAAHGCRHKSEETAKCSGSNQEELASEAGIDRNYVGMIEREESSPTVDTIEKIAQALNIEPEKLLIRHASSGGLRGLLGTACRLSQGFSISYHASTKYDPIVGTAMSKSLCERRERSPSNRPQARLLRSCAERMAIPARVWWRSFRDSP